MHSISFEGFHYVIGKSLNFSQIIPTLERTVVGSVIDDILRVQLADSLNPLKFRFVNGVEI